ncbi:MAG: MmgE/PrpD family protein, partial [Acidimicrobiales bacterium]
WASGQGWGLVSWQIYAPVIAAAKLMGLDTDGIVKALGAAYYQVIITADKHIGGNQVGASDIYHYAHGFCNRNGICAAQMAELGFDGMTDSLDGPNGLWAKVSDRVDWSWHDRELGSRYLILETLYKRWPANMWIQGPLDALDALCREHDLGPDQVDRITSVVVSPTIPMIMENSIGRYDGVLDAQFHLPYCFAAYLLDREPGQHWFDEDHRRDPAIRKLAERVTSTGESLTPIEAFEIFWTGSFPLVSVTLTLDDRTFTHTLRYPKGHPRNPFTWDETEQLFRHTVRDVLDTNAADRVIDLVKHLDGQQNLHELAGLLANPAS